MGQPDVQLKALPDGKWQVEVNGFDYFDTAKGELVSGGKAKIAAWSLDTTTTAAACSRTSSSSPWRAKMRAG
jgi:hypothetical protein